MMIFIDIETEALKGMSNAANAALGELQHADSILRGVTEHHDWGCKERDQVNDHIQKARTQMTRIKNDGNQFNNTVSTVLEEFLETERGIGDMFTSLEEVIAQALNSWDHTGGHHKPTININDIISVLDGKKTKLTDGAESFWTREGLIMKSVLNRLISPPPVINFNTLQKGLEE